MKTASTWRLPDVPETAEEWDLLCKIADPPHNIGSYRQELPPIVGLHEYAIEFLDNFHQQSAFPGFSEIASILQNCRRFSAASMVRSHICNHHMCPSCYGRLLTELIAKIGVEAIEQSHTYHTSWELHRRTPDDLDRILQAFQMDFADFVKEIQPHGVFFAAFQLQHGYFKKWHINAFALTPANIGESLPMKRTDVPPLQHTFQHASPESRRAGSGDIGMRSFSYNTSVLHEFTRKELEVYTSLKFKPWGYYI